MRVSSRPVVLAISLLSLAAMALPFFDHTVDDAFISFRYARNLVEGHGLVFNPGERVEGYTNFLWVMLIAPCIALGVDPVLAGRAWGLAAAVALVGAVVRLSPRPERAPEAAWIAPLLTATSPPLAVWASGGLEAPLFAALAAWSVVLAARDVDQRTLRPWTALVPAAAALTRPEGLGLALVLFGVTVALARPRARHAAGWCAVLAAVVLPYFAWRFSYYGDWLPNTFHAKVGTSGAQVARGARYVVSFFQASGIWLLLPLAGLVWRPRKAEVTIAGVAAAALAGAVVLVGGDSLPMFRFLVPVLPLGYVLAGHGAAAALARFGASRTLRTTVALAALALVARSALPAFTGPAARLVDVDRREVASWIAIGRHFGEHARPGDSLAVITAGAMPYYSGLPTVDMLGLNDRTIARRNVAGLGTGFAGHEKFDVDYVLDRRPTYVVIGTYGLSPDPRPATDLVRAFYPAERALLEFERFAREYRLVRGRTPAGYFAFFVRHDAAGAPPAS
jgi:hypothetical protein